MSAVLRDTKPSPLDQVRRLLKEWVLYRRRWRPDNGYPSKVSWIDVIRGAVDGWAESEDYDERIYACQMRHVDQAVRGLSSDHQHAINVEYLNEIGPLVWRSARKTKQEIRLLCIAAELALVPVLRRRDVIR